MADRKGIVCRRIPGAKARPAERSFQHRACLHQLRRAAVFHQLHIDRHGCRINTQCERIGSDARVVQDVRRGTDILKSAARTARDDPLFHIQLSIPHFVLESEVHRAVQADERFLLTVVEDIQKVRIQLLDGVGVARVERHRDHRLYLAQIDFDAAVIVGDLSRI